MSLLIDFLTLLIDFTNLNRKNVKCFQIVRKGRCHLQSPFQRRLSVRLEQTFDDVSKRIVGFIESGSKLGAKSQFAVDFEAHVLK